MAKKFMFVCFGILALAAAYAVGASNSVAQIGGPGAVVHGFVANGGGYCVITDNGSIYGRAGYPEVSSGAVRWSQSGTWQYIGGVFDGAVNAEANSLGGVKGLFR